MMDVVVDDRHALKTARAGVRSGNGDVVEEAEPHRTVSLGVMPGRPDEGQRPGTGAAIEHVLDRRHRRTRRDIRGFERPGRRERIRIQGHGAARGLLDRREVVGVVNPRELLVGHAARLEDAAAPLAEL